MSETAFIHLRVHTAYSLSEGAIAVKDLVKRCVRDAIPAVAVTDSNNMFAALEFSLASAEAGVQPLHGLSLNIKKPFQDIDEQRKNNITPPKIILIAENELGYQNLMKLNSKAHLLSDPLEGVQLDLAHFEGLSEGIICLTGGIDGPVGQWLLQNQPAKAENSLALLKQLFPERLYVEITRHERPQEAQIEEALLDLAYAHNLPIVATNQPFFLDADLYEAHDTLLCIADGTYVSEENRRKLNPHYRFKSASEMKDLFQDLPEAIENTVKIAKRCHYRVQKVDPLLPNFTKGQGRSETEVLRDMAEAGLKERLAFLRDNEHYLKEKGEKTYWDRLEFELGVINQMGFPGYFLIVADFIQWAKKQHIPVGPGRGSGAGSVVAWSLKITDLDPLRFSLLFERFLNPERISMPDFDIDFCQDRREEVIRYVQDRYGHDHVAQIITFGKLQARAVVKACGRALQQPYMVTDRLSKLIPNAPGSAMTLREAIDSEERLRQEIASDDLTAMVIDRALKLEGLYAHSSTHAAGVVIGDRPLDQLVPLYRDPKSDMPVTQFNMKWVELAGLVKFDFLGLKTLTVLERAVAYVRARAIEIDLERLPLDDVKSYNLLMSGEAAGIFQLESSGMRAVLKGLKPDCFEDIIALVALYRPGPMDNIPTYINRKHKREEIDYPHPMLEGLLKETNGIIVYQEQVMEIAQVLSGYSLGEADLLRRAMGKKIKAEMDQQRSRFVSGAEKNGIKASKAEEIFDLVTKFASYGFNKSHAAAYALVAYQTAYMKANYPVEFMAAIMTLDLNNTDKLGFFKQELQRMQVPLLLPDINKSGAVFITEKTDDYGDADDPRANLGVRYALSAIKGVGAKAIEAIVAERAKNGLFKDIFDFAERVDPKLLNKRQIEHLASAGAFDQLWPNRAQMHAGADIILKYAQLAEEERASAQVSLFGEANGAVMERPSLPDVAEWTSIEALNAEHKAVGFYLSAHPLDNYSAALARERVVPAVKVMGSQDYIGQTVKMAGAVVGWRESRSKNTGRKFGSLSLTDQTSAFEVMAFEDDLPRVRDLIAGGAPFLLDIQIRPGRGDDEPVRLTARGFFSLEEVAANSSKALILDIASQTTKEDFARLGHILERKKGGRGRVSFRLPLEGGKGYVEFDLAERYLIAPELRQALSAMKSVENSEEI